jgi:CBS domain-containing protein
MEVTAETILNGADASVANAFAAFCEDIGGMFDVTADCTALGSGKGFTADLKKDFKKQISINHVQSKGAMQGSFDLVFDQAGTLIMAGIFVMLPEKRILEYVRSGYSGESDFISDAIREAGNLLVGSWDRVYRAEMKGHKHFVQSGTAVGEPWDSPEEYFGFSPEEECFYRICQITINPYPPFKCAAVFPMSIFSPDGNKASESAAPPEPAAQAEPDTPAAETPVISEPTASPAKSESPASEAPQAAVEDNTSEQTEPRPQTDETASDNGSAAADEPSFEAEKIAAAATAFGPVRQAIDTMIRPPQHTPASQCDLLASMTAEQVMKPAVLWADPEDTVEQVMKQMQQNEAAYVLVGRDQQVEGLVSRSVIASAVSPYMRAVFAHMKRPLDDASLQIRIKWFMSRPVHTVGPQATLETVIHTMFKYGVRGLPVVDVKGYVSGFITAFDVLAALSAQSDSPLLGKPAQAPMCL